MKSVYSLLLVTLFSVNAFAQKESDDDDDQKGGFKKENLFTGGSVNVSLGGGTTALGISPYFGYSVNRYLDVAVSAGINYISQRQYDPYYYNYLGKVRQTIYGPGAFVRVFPLKFLFLQAQYEYNIIKYKLIYANSQPTDKFNYNASSLLLGAGYAGGREEGSNSFYYFSVAFDVAGSKNSPYIDYNTSGGGKRVIPIIRAGYNIALFQNKVVRGRRTSED